MTDKLIRGVDTFDPAGWSGAGIAAAGDYEISVPFSPIKSGLNQSGIVGGLNSMSFVEGAEGFVGGGSDGDFIADFDSTATSFLRNRGNVEMHVRAGGDSNLCNNLDVGGLARMHCKGGKFADITQDGGKLTLNASTTSDNFWAMGGTSVHKYNAAAHTGVYIGAGKHTLHRAAGLIYVGGGELILDADDAASFVDVIFVQMGGRFTLKAGLLPSLECYGGVFDQSMARGDIGAIGAVKYIVSGTRIIKSQLVDNSNAVNVGQLGREVGDPVHAA